MSIEENTKLVQHGYQLFGTGDIPGLLEDFSDDIEWAMPEIENVPLTRTYRGKKEVGGFFISLAEQIEFHQFEPREFIAQNDKVAVLGHVKSTVKSTGKHSEYDFLHLFTVKNGKTVRFQEFLDTHQISEAYKS